MFGILKRENGVGNIKNIGDYVQSIAQRQFLSGKKTCYVEIEELSSFKSDEKVNVIMNGWFMHNPNAFPPSDSINPLFISFHLTPPAEKDFFTPQTIEYLKKHEPIGTRDTLTAEIMQKHGIDAYMTGCLTLTLGKQYGGQQHDGDYIIVDPYFEFGGNVNQSYLKKIFKTLYFCLKNARKTIRLQKKYLIHGMFSNSKLPKCLTNFMEVATFYEIYSKRFSDEILLNAEYKTVIIDNNLSNEQKFEIADMMLKEYAKAKFVITSRLHVAFPCLAMNTKNIFIIPSEDNDKKDIMRYRGRINGLEDTVTILELNKGKLINTMDDLPQIIDSNNIPDNKEGYLRYSKALSDKIMKFVSNNI